MSNESTGVRQVFFKFYDDYAESYIKFLTGDQLKTLLLALVDFHRDGVVTDFSDDPIVGMAYNAICGNIVRDEKKYQDAVKRKKESRERQKGPEQQPESKDQTGDIFGTFV